jgi:pimeloyl-ACP methyl ester carboxylesterase
MAVAVRSRVPAEVTQRAPLLFVHGAWHGAWCWEPMAEWFAERGWAAHSLDLRGHGASEANRSLRWLSIADYVDDVAGVVSGLAPAPVLVGHSMGGLVVQKYLEAAAAPAAVLLAPVPVGGVLGATLRVARRHPLLFLRANATMSLWPLIGSPPRAREMFFASDMADDEVAGHFGMLQDESYRAYLDMILRRPRPAAVRTPILVVGGAEDRIFTPAEMERTAAAYGTSAVVVAGAAHDLMLDARWEQTAATMADWIAHQLG